jgi:hypothetical protein
MVAGLYFYCKLFCYHRFNYRVDYDDYTYYVHDWELTHGDSLL